ncbi:MAG: glucose-6-phosphate isomerase [Alphaproteobacteria bacterium]|nr:glucose-6-phosphate isomerase [Alphaproteobacteria bacterium]
MIPYTQDVSQSLGRGAFAGLDLAPWKAQAKAILADLSRERRTGALELLTICDRADDLAAAKPLAEALLKDTSDLVLLGTGGSSLGAQAIAQLTGRLTPFSRGAGPQLHFFDNLDGETYSRAFAAFDWRTTRFLVVSKSGTTGETMMQALAAIKALEDAGGGKYAKHHFTFLTEPGGNAMRKLAGELGAPVADHPLGIGGRYSVLSLVGLLPAMLMGVDPALMRAGARDVLAAIETGDPDQCPPALGALQLAALMEAKGLRQIVLWAYADRLERFVMWWRQLWGESVGKDGKGSTPIPAVGPVDQHSQLQLYLGGPDDKHYTFLLPPRKGQGPVTHAALAEKIGMASVGGYAIGDLVAAQALATPETLIAHGRPVRRMTLPVYDARALGALFMHFMLETIIAARLMGVDPFDQPAVEEGKVLARTYLADGKG